MKKLGKFFKSFFFAGRGIVSTVIHERNMRVHLDFAVYMFSILGFTDWFKLTRGEWAALIITASLLLFAELVNTALEHAVDLASGGEISEHAKMAKDAASGAVLVLAIGAVAVGVKILAQREAFVAMGEYFASHIFALVVFILSIALAVFLIFFDGFKKKK